MIANSVVVRFDRYDRSDIISLTNRDKVKRAFIVWGACCLIIVGASSYMLTQQSGTTSLIDEMTRIQQIIESDTHLKNVSIRHSYHTYKGAEGVKTSTTSINVFSFLHKNKFDNTKFRETEIEHVAKIVASSYSKIDECDYINVQVRTGFNIGISNYYVRENTHFDKQGDRIEQEKDTPEVNKEAKL